MIDNFRVMKCTSITEEDMAKLRFPVYVSEKLDGIRATVWSDGVYSSTNKPIPNKFIQKELEHEFNRLGLIVDYNMFDGELIVGSTFQETSSGVMSREGEPDFTYYIFDMQYVDCVGTEKFSKTQSILDCFHIPSKYIELVTQYVCNNVEEINKIIDQVRAKGGEGIIIRTPDGKYKCGRATKKDNIIFRYKFLEDSEAIITGFEEMMHNLNEAEENELGLTKRSSCIENKVPANTLGKFYVKDIHTGVEFEIGTGKGLTKKLKQEIWDNQDKYLSKIIKYQSLKVGVKDKPRQPSFLGFRDEADITKY